jgi:hypothetical protein
MQNAIQNLKAALINAELAYYATEGTPEAIEACRAISLSEDLLRAALVNLENLKG